MIGVFIDGPLAGEVRQLPLLPRSGIWYVPLPERVTICDCDPNEGAQTCSKGPDVVEYHVICHGPRVAILALDGDDEQILRKLDSWLVSDLGNPRWVRHCRDRRAFT